MKILTRPLLIPCFLTAILSALFSCSSEQNIDHSLKAHSNCFSTFKDPFWLGQFAKYLINQNIDGSKEILDSIDSKMKKDPQSTSPSAMHNLGMLRSYFKDLSSSNSSAKDGSHLPFKPINNNDVLVIDLKKENLPQVEVQERPPIKQAFWNLWPIPESMHLRNYPLYRGDEVFTQMSFSRNILAEDSPLWPRLNELFSKGMFILKKDRAMPLHKDVYEHTIDSSSSIFISSSKDFYVALDFGRNQKIAWSAVLEFRGDGIDVVATGKYFDSLPFSDAMPALMPLEKEVSIANGVDAHNIRGIWLLDNTGRVVFIKNPNFKEI